MPSSNCESLWVKIKSNSSKFIYLGVIYRHPNQQLDDFEKDLNGLLTNFNLNNDEHLTTGDFNIDLLKSASDNKVGRYHQNLESHGRKPLINEPTRFSSTVSPSPLDHIYCKLRNTTQIAGIAIFGESDHLSVFLFLSTSINRKSEKQIIRCMKKFNLENFLIDLEEALSPWNFNTGSTVHNDFYELIHIFQTIINKHAPLRKLSREKQLQAQPWITRGLLTSIKNKNRMFRKCYKCKDAKLIAQYKNYTNKLTRLRKIAKQQYYFKLFQKCRSDSKKNTENY